MAMGILLLIFNLFFAFSSSAAEARRLVVIANPAIPAETMRMVNVRDIFLGEQQFQGKVKLNVIDQRDSEDAKKYFVSEVLGLSLPKYKTYWIQRVFQGLGFPPVIEDSDKIQERVQKEAGAIAYVWEDEIKNAKSFKILFTYPVVAAPPAADVAKK